MLRRIKKRRTFSVLTILIILTGVVISVFFTNEEENYTVEQITIVDDMVMPENIEEMAHGSDIVVVGYFDKMVNKMNLLRDPNDILKEDPNQYEEAHVYEFNIEEVIAGDSVADKINIALNYSLEYEFTDERGNIKNMEIVNPLYKVPNSNQKYVLFLHENKELDTYFIPFYPYSFLVTEEGKIKADTNTSKNLHEITSRNRMTFSETKEEVQVYYNEEHSKNHNEVLDQISGEKLLEIKNTIKENF